VEKGKNIEYSINRLYGFVGSAIVKRFDGHFVRLISKSIPGLTQANFYQKNISKNEGFQTAWKVLMGVKAKFLH